MADESDGGPLQFAQFFNDVVVVTYEDGSSLQLSPCGNQFVHLTPPSGKTAALSASTGAFRVQQKSEFATSAFRAKVREALQFRNMFATRPFVCHLLMDERSCGVLKDAVEPGGAVEWPADVNAVDIADNGRLVLRALRPASCVVHLTENRQEFRSEFAVQLPPSRLKDGASLAAVRVTGHHSLRHVPECWRPAVNLLLQSIGVPPDCSSPPSAPSLPEPLPLRCPKQHLHKFERAGPSLPEENPTSSGLGWLVCAEGRRLLKALCLEGVLYRLHPPPHLTVEIYPGDGSILVSNNLTGCFFTHFLPACLLDELNPSEAGSDVVERVYSTSAPPASFARKSDYNLGRVLTRGRLLCEYLAECLTILGSGEALVAPADCCWRASDDEAFLEAEMDRALSRLSARGSDKGAKDSHRSSGSESRRSESRREVRSSGRCSDAKIVEENGNEKDEEELSSRRLLEKNEVHDVGTFTAAASGRVQILFRDRVSLDMRADLSRRLALDGRRPPPSRYDVCPDLPPAGYARIFTRDGRFVTVSVQQPEPEFERYINSALEWIDWVNCSPEERSRFYTERPQPPCPQAELKKIECFNYILESSGQNYGTVADTDPYDCAYVSRTNQIKSIEETLAKTSQFLKDLDSLRSKKKL